MWTTDAGAPTPAAFAAPSSLPRCSTDSRRSRSGLFAHPPAPRSFNTTGSLLLRDMLAIEARGGWMGCCLAAAAAYCCCCRGGSAPRLRHPPAACSSSPLLPPSSLKQVPITLNAAFCERHRRVCPPSDELERECGKVGGCGWRCGWGEECGRAPGAAVPLPAHACRPPELLPTRCPVQAEALMAEFDAVMATIEIPDPCRDHGEPRTRATAAQRAQRRAPALGRRCCSAAGA